MSKLAFQENNNILHYTSVDSIVTRVEPWCKRAKLFETNPFCHQLRHWLWVSLLLERDGETKIQKRVE